ncbi:hypothetical protein D3C87_2081380 [compost metagenome]
MVTDRAEAEAGEVAEIVRRLPEDHRRILMNLVRAYALSIEEEVLEKGVDRSEAHDQPQS